MKKRHIPPFRFYTYSVLVKLTGRKAVGLSDLLEHIRTISGSSIFYHTYQRFWENPAIRSVPLNDFSYWVGEVLGEKELEEKLASIDIFGFVDLRGLRNRIAEIIQNQLEFERNPRQAPQGSEFHFCEAVSIVMPTQIEAGSLEEFESALEKVEISSFYYHFLQARLRLARQTNDFSLWLEKSLGEQELALKISKIDISLFSPEEMRQKVVDLIRTHRKGRKRSKWIVATVSSAILSAGSFILSLIKKKEKKDGSSPTG